MKFPKSGARFGSSRRRFLTLHNSEDPSSTLRDLEYGGRHWVRVGRRAMACLFEFILPPTARARLMEIHRVLDEIDRCESLMSTYREDSHLSAINRNGFPGPVTVDEGLFPVLMLSRRLWEETGGAFDITAGALTRCWGFHNRQGRIPALTELSDALLQVGTQHIELDPSARSIRFRRPLELNLGAIGKGHALDRAAELLSEAGFDDALLHAGSSSILVRGAYGFQGQPGWPLAVVHPVEADRNIVSLRLENAAMSTSGVREQQFQAEGSVFGHILDPRTGYPAKLRCSATAIAPSAAEADALSTAFFVMRDGEIEAFCEINPTSGAILIDRNQPTGEVVVKSFGVARDFVEVLCE